MKIGLDKHWGVYEIRIDADFSALNDPPVGLSNTGISEVYTGQFEDAFGSEIRPIDMTIVQSRDGIGPDTLMYTLDIRGEYSDRTISLAYAATTYARLVFTNLKLWWTGLNYRLTWDSWDWYTDSTLYHSAGAGSQEYPFWAAKCALPIVGVQPTIVATLLAEAPSAPLGLGIAATVSGKVVTTGGWRFQYPGSATWQTPRVTTNVLPPGMVPGCPAGVVPYVSPTASNTWDGRVEAYVDQVFDASGNPLSTQGWGGELTLADNCPASVGLLDDDYAAVLYRGGMPRTEHKQWATCTSGGSTTTFEAYTEEHPLMSELLYETTDPADPIFDQFTYDLIAPYQQAGFTADLVTGKSHTGEVRFPERVTFDGTQLGYYYSVQPLCAYLNYWGARHQHLLYWFPDDEGAGVQWPVNGVEPSSTQYWMLLAKQWRNHPSLSGGGAQTQVNIPWAPLLKGISATGIHIKLRIFANAATSFVGLHNFESQTPTIPPSVTLDSDSEDAWTFDDCTAVFGGAGITLTPTGSPAQIVATFDAGKFGVSPYLLPLLSESLQVDIDPTNVDSMEAFLTDSLDKELSISTGPFPDTHAFTSSQDEYYAGSWAQDHGGIAVSNFGLDQEPTGQSIAHMSVPEFVHPFQMFTGRGAHKLKFVIEPTNPAATVLLKYPTYTYCDNPDPVFVAENSAQVTILWPDGPAHRWGQWNWFWGGDVQDTPIVRSSIDRSSALDCLVTRRVVFEGVAGTDGLLSEIASLYDLEGSGPLGLVTFEDMTWQTLGFWIPGIDPLRFGFTNLYREMPPMSGWPEPDRDPATLERISAPTSSDLVLKVWDYAFEKRKFPCKTKDTNPVQLFDDAGVQQSVTGSTVSGWTVSEFNDPVTMDEALDWTIRHDGTVYAKVRPWDGFFSLIYLQSGSAFGVSYDVNRSWRHKRAYVDGSSTLVGAAGNAPLPLAFADAPVLSGGDWASIRFNKRGENGHLWLAREASGAIVLYRSVNGGQSFSLVGIIGAGTKPSLCTCETGDLMIYWIDGGALKGQVRDKRGTVKVATFTVVGAGVDDEGIAAYETFPGPGRSIALLYVSGGNVTRRTSTNGVSFGAGTVVAAGKKPAGCAFRDSGILECWIDGTAVKGRRLDVAGNVVAAISTWVASGVDDGQIAVQWSAGSIAGRRAVLLYPSSGAIAQVVSKDGTSSWS